MTEMSPAEAVFYAAAALPAENRAAYLATACAGRDDLRRRVEQMLAVRGEVGEFLEPDRTVTYTPEAVAVTPAGGTPDLSGSGSVLADKYLLLDLIGEGGMGRVYLARQTEPVRRDVAVKVLKPGMDTAAVLARFEAERQALAVMDHPHIAKVFDAGTTASGRPFFVMELVKGVPITEYCDAGKLTPQQRLELFVPVCQAIQHAHQKGVIHRDIKPSNVLVALSDDKPVPKVIDFGIAKATGQPLTDNPLHTGYGDVIGTPQYMSPEQAALNNPDVDTRSDVYSLGVLLYELLAGSPPFARRELDKRGLLEILRVVREEEPPKPSTKLSTADALPSLAANRGTEPKKLTGLLRNELDWVVMKALEKDRTRRYETASGFAADVQRHLAGEPVTAHPPTASYRLRKFVRKNRVAVAAGGLVAATLVGGLVATSYGFYRADVQRQRADDNARAAEAAAAAERTAQRRAAEQRAAAEKARDRTRDVLDAMTSAVTGNSLATQKAVTDEQKTFLGDVLTFYKELARENGDDATTRVRVANAALRVGLIEYRLGRKAEAAAAILTARNGFAALASASPAVTGHRQDLALCHNNLGYLLTDLGQPAEALTECRSGLELRQQLVADQPTVEAYQSDLAASRINLGLLLGRSGRVQEALDQYSQALPTYDALVTQFPKLPEHRHDRVKLRSNMGMLLAQTSRTTDALAQFTHGVAEAERLSADYPAAAEYQYDLALCHTNLAELYRELGRRDAALEQSRKSVGVLEGLVAKYPAVPDYQIDLGRGYCDVGYRARDGGQLRDSLGWFDKAVRTLTAAARSAPADPAVGKFLRNSHAGRAGVHERLGNTSGAVPDWDRAVELSGPEERPKVRAIRAVVYLRAGKAAEALAEVAELTKEPKWSANQWCDFARVYSLTATTAGTEKQPRADRAMELLRAAVQAGWKDATKLRRDPDFVPLRARDDFQKLLTDLEGVNRPTREVLPMPRASSE